MLPLLVAIFTLSSQTQFGCCGLQTAPGRHGFTDNTIATAVALATDLHGNDLKEWNIRPDSFSRLSAMTWLSLGPNQLIDVNPSTLEALTVAELGMDSNQSTAVDPRKPSEAVMAPSMDSNPPTAVDPPTSFSKTALTGLYLYVCAVCAMCLCCICAVSMPAKATPG